MKFKMKAYSCISLRLLISLSLTGSISISQDWVNVSSPFGALTGVVMVDSQTMLLSGSKGILISRDNGSHWTLSNKGLTASYVQSLLMVGNVVIAASPRSIFRSTDGGIQWEKTSFPDTIISKILVSRQGLIVAKAETGDFYMSGDSAKSWKPLNAGKAIGDEEKIRQTYRFEMNERGHLFFGFDSCSFMRTRDNGRTWDRTKIPVMKSRHRLGVAVKGNVIAVSSWEKEGAISIDDGKTWKKVTPPGGGRLMLQFSLTGDIMLQTMEPDGKYQSSDNGRTWSAFQSQIEINSYCHMDGDTLIAVGRVYHEGSALVRSNDRGKTWEAMIVSFTDAVILTVNPAGELYAGTEWCGSFKSDDFGNSWEPLLSVPTIKGIAFVGNNVVAIVSSLDGVFTSTDAGRRWNNANEHGLLDTSMTSLAATPHGVLFAGAFSKFLEKRTPDGRGMTLTHRGGGLWRSIDNGGSWQRVILDKSFSTTDSGKNWTQYESQWKRTTTYEGSNPDFTVNSIGFNPAGNLIVDAKVHYRKGIYTSSDNGETWTMQAADERSLMSKTKYVSTSSGEIFLGNRRSSDRGKTFSEIIDGLTSGIGNVQPLPDGDVLGTSESGLYYLPQGGNTWFLVAFEKQKVSAIVLHGGYVFASVDYGYGDQRNGVYKIDFQNLRPKFPKQKFNEEIWREVNHPLKNGVSIFTIDNVGNLWLVDDKGMLARSADKGKYWTTSQLPDDYVRSFVVHPSGKYLLAGTWEGLFKSSTEAKTWDKVLLTAEHSDESRIRVGALYFGKDGTVFVGTSESGPFRNPCADTTKKVLSFVNFGGSETGRIYFQKRNSKAWIASATTFPNSPIEFFRSKKGTLFVSVDGEGLYRSLDEGKTWVASNGGLLPKDAVYTCSIGADIDRTVNCAAIDSRGIIYAARGWGQISRSKDDGKTWEDVSRLGSGIYAFFIGSNNILFAGTPMGIFRSSDEGKTWRQFSTGLTSGNVAEIKLHPDGHLYAATSDGRLFVSVQSLSSYR